MISCIMNVFGINVAPFETVIVLSQDHDAVT
jgi:hypothetical protein